jgi:hypothetical protein
MGYGCFLPRAEYAAPIALDGVISRNGPYLNSPEQAVVFCCHEKSQIQALPRSQPSLPLCRGWIPRVRGNKI